MDHTELYQPKYCVFATLLDTGRVKKVPTGKAGCINASSFHVLLHSICTFSAYLIPISYQTERTLPPIPFWFLTPKNMFAGKGRFLVRGSFAHRLSLLLKSSKERLPISGPGVGNSPQNYRSYPGLHHRWWSIGVHKLWHGGSHRGSHSSYY